MSTTINEPKHSPTGTIYETPCYRNHKYIDIQDIANNHSNSDDKKLYEDIINFYNENNMNTLIEIY